MYKIFLLICLVLYCFIFNLFIGAEGIAISFARRQIPVYLRRMLFCMPQRYKKFTLHGVVFSIYTHILLILSVVLVLMEQDNLNSLIDKLCDIWILSQGFQLILLAICYGIDFFFGEKEAVKKEEVFQSLYKNKFIEFTGFKVISKAVVSENTNCSPKGIVLILPAALSVDYQGYVVQKGERLSVKLSEIDKFAYNSTYGNYEEVSNFLNSEGYSTIRMNFTEYVSDYGYYDYVKELKAMCKILNENYGFVQNLILFGHGPIGSVTVMDVYSEIPAKGIIMMGGASVTPYEDAYQYLKANKQKFVESDILFWKEILSIKSDTILEKLKAIFIPTLVMFTMEELVYNLTLVESAENINNSNLVIKRLFGTTGVLVERDLSKFDSLRLYVIREDRKLTVCKRVKQAIKAWLNDTM